MNAPIKTESTLIELEPHKMGFAFDNYVVSMFYDFSDIDVSPAHIHAAEVVTTQGFVPGTSRWGDIQESRVQITLDLDKSNLVNRNEVTFHLGAIQVFGGKPNIYKTFLPESEIGKLRKHKSFIIGIFKTKKDALNAIEKMQAEYAADCQRRIEALPALNEISKRFDYPRLPSKGENH